MSDPISTLSKGKAALRTLCMWGASDSSLGRENVGTGDMEGAVTLWTLDELRTPVAVRLQSQPRALCFWQLHVNSGVPQGGPQVCHCGSHPGQCTCPCWATGFLELCPAFKGHAGDECPPVWLG